MQPVVEVIKVSGILHFPITHNVIKIHNLRKVGLEMKTNKRFTLAHFKQDCGTLKTSLILWLCYESR